VSQLNGGQASRLSDALREAFLPGALDEMLYYMLDVRREDITLADNYRSRAFQLIRQAEAEGWILDLIVSARMARPQNAALQGLAAELGLGAAAPQNLERIINESVPFLDVSAWRARLGELEGQVCRVEVRAGRRVTIGTGFLVGPDLCLTNYHVAQPLIDGVAAPADTRLRFDYRRTPDGTTVSHGTCFSLAEDWLVKASAPSPADLLPDSRGQLPAPDELDFALLRVRDSPGEAPIGKAGQLTDAEVRGWVKEAGSTGFEPESPLFLLQHPEGAPLKLSFGPSSGLNDNGTRLRYRVNSEPGSSGSPCLNAMLELVGMHHAGDPNFDRAHKPAYNSAIPIKAILDDLAGDPVRAKIFQHAT
jgi:hypothetical protein